MSSVFGDQGGEVEESGTGTEGGEGAAKRDEIRQETGAGQVLEGREGHGRLKLLFRVKLEVIAGS